MPGLDRKLDFETGDYVDDGAGGYVDVDTVETAGYHQIKTHRGAWPLDTTKGSVVHLIARLGASEATLSFLEDSLRGALQALIDAGLARSQNVEVGVSKLTPDRILWLAELVDRHGGSVDLSEIGGTGG